METQFEETKLNQAKKEVITRSIENVIIKRAERGATDEQLIKWIDHLKKDVWNNTPELVNVCNGFIDAIKQTPGVAR